MGTSRHAGGSGALPTARGGARPVPGWRTLGRWIVALGLPVAVAVAWIPARRDNSSVDVALALLVVIAAAGATGRRAVVAGAAVSAAIGFTYFDTTPFDHFAITKAPDVVTAVLLVLVGAATGELAVRVARQRRSERSGLGDMGRVRRASASLAAGEELVAMIGWVADELTRLLDLRDCWFTAEPIESGALRVSRDGRLVRDASDGVQGQGSSQLVLPVWGQGQVVGHFVLEPRPGHDAGQEQLLVGVTLADQVGAALFVQAPPDPAPPRPGDGPLPGLHVVR